jgi:predicted PurR-regulated permease PerM
LLDLGRLAVVYTLYFGKEIILPIVVALVLRLLLAPAQRLLTDRGHLPSQPPRVLVLTLFGAIAVAAFTLSISAAIQKAPESLPVLKERLAILRQRIDLLHKGLKGSRNVDDCNRSGKRIGASGYCLTELRTHPWPSVRSNCVFGRWDFEF